MKYLCFSALLLLAACAHRERPLIVPVATSCVTGEIPAPPSKVRDRLTGDAGTDLGIIAGSLVETRAWGEMLYKMLQACKV